MIRAILLFIVLIPSVLYADEGLNLSCKNMLSAFGRNYELLNFKLEVTGFHYFDENHNTFKVIPSKDLDIGEDRFTAKFPEYELGFQMIVFAGDTKPTITMSKYDHINNKFIDHYECAVVKAYID